MSDTLRSISLSDNPEITIDAPSFSEVAQRVFDVFGLKVSPPLAIIIVAAGCFFLGVIIASIMSAGEPGRRVRTLAAAPMAFLLTAAIWFPLLNGQLISTSIAPIDAFVAWAVGEGEIHNQLFLLGIVMLFGAMSLPIYELGCGLLQRALGLVGRKIAPNTPPANPTG